MSKSKIVRGTWFTADWCRISAVAFWKAVFLNAHENLKTNV